MTAMWTFFSGVSAQNMLEDWLPMIVKRAVTGCRVEVSASRRQGLVWARGTPGV